MEIKNINSVLAGIDRISEAATKTFKEIPSEALRDANVVDLTASDMAERLASKVASTKSPKKDTPTPETKRPTIG